MKKIDRLGQLSTETLNHWLWESTRVSKEQKDQLVCLFLAYILNVDPEDALKFISEADRGKVSAELWEEITTHGDNPLRYFYGLKEWQNAIQEFWQSASHVWPQIALTPVHLVYLLNMGNPLDIGSLFCTLHTHNEASPALVMLIEQTSMFKGLGNNTIS